VMRENEISGDDTREALGDLHNATEDALAQLVDVADGIYSGSHPVTANSLRSCLSDATVVIERILAVLP